MDRTWARKFINTFRDAEVQRQVYVHSCRGNQQIAPTMQNHRLTKPQETFVLILITLEIRPEKSSMGQVLNGSVDEKSEPISSELVQTDEPVASPKNASLFQPLPMSSVQSETIIKVVLLGGCVGKVRQLRHPFTK